MEQLLAPHVVGNRQPRPSAPALRARWSCSSPPALLATALTTRWNGNQPRPTNHERARQLLPLEPTKAAALLSCALLFSCTHESVVLCSHRWVACPLGIACCVEVHTSSLYISGSRTTQSVYIRCCSTLCCVIPPRTHSSLMAPVRIGQKKIAAEKRNSVMIPSFKRFDDVEDIFELPRTWSVVVRVEVKFPVEPRYHDKQHFILVDTNGSKIEAISYNNDVRRFDNLLHQGCNYTIHRVIFGLNWGEVVFRNIAHRIELTLTSNTTVEPYTMPLRFPRCPRHLMPFHEVLQQPNKTLVDVMGIIVRVEPVERIGRRRYREIVLLDARWNLINFGVCGDLLNQNALQWQRTKSNYTIIVGTMLRYDSRYRCLESSDHTTLDFNPRHEEKKGFETIQQMIMKRKNLRFVNRFLEDRWAYLATVLPN